VDIDARLYSPPKRIVGLVDANASDNDLGADVTASQESLEAFDMCVTTNEDHTLIRDIMQLIKPELLTK
jgi:hypothetical protein